MFSRLTNELYRRAHDGTLDVDSVLEGLKLLIKGKLSSKTVDLDAQPFIPEDSSVEEHRKGGMLVFSPESIGLYLSGRQKGDGLVKGHGLREELEALTVLNANLLDWLLKPENQHLIPKEWRGKAVCFWGTIYRRPDGCLYVRYLHWGVVGWNWSPLLLDSGFYSADPAVVSVS
jgi:hypothetical protein